ERRARHTAKRTTNETDQGKGEGSPIEGDEEEGEAPMRIHHFTIPARDPERVARVIAELLGGKVIPLPKPPGTLIVYAGDADGSLIEIMPASTRGGPDDD